jgi:hypothetical protein
VDGAHCLREASTDGNQPRAGWADTSSGILAATTTWALFVLPEKAVLPGEISGCTPTGGSGMARPAKRAPPITASCSWTNYPGPRNVCEMLPQPPTDGIGDPCAIGDEARISGAMHDGAGDEPLSVWFITD